jgi:cell division protein FtsQ
MSYRRTRRPVRRPRRYVLRSKVKAERRQRFTKAGIVLLLLAGIGFGGWKAWQAASCFVSSAPCFTIRSITVRGGKNISPSEIIALLPFRAGDNILHITPGKAERAIRQCKPELKDIAIRRSWKKVVITLVERQPVACVQSGGRRLGVDADNAVFSLRGHQVTQKFPEIVAAAAAERKDVLAFIRTFSAQAKELFPRVTRLFPEPVNAIVLELDDGTRIFWGPIAATDVRQKLRRLSQVMADARTRYTGIEYINLCYFDDGRIVVKPRSAGERQQQAAAAGHALKVSCAR